jgi:hypothetical protein
MKDILSFFKNLIDHRSSEGKIALLVAPVLAVFLGCLLLMQDYGILEAPGPKTSAFEQAHKEVTALKKNIPEMYLASFHKATDGAVEGTVVLRYADSNLRFRGSLISVVLVLIGGLCIAYCGAAFALSMYESKLKGALEGREVLVLNGFFIFSKVAVVGSLIVCVVAGWALGMLDPFQFISDKLKLK